MLGRIGRTREALSLIIEELQDIEQAVKFCKEHDDQDLWEDLISSSISKPGMTLSSSYLTTLFHSSLDVWEKHLGFNYVLYANA